VFERTAAASSDTKITSVVTKAFATFAMGSLLFDFAVCDSASPYLLGFPWFRVSHCGNLEQ
jgi:hypothetical protein